MRLGYIGPPTQPFLGRLLKEYRQRYPRVALHLEERTPERVWEMVAKGRLSVALTRPVTLEQPLGLQTVLLRKERLGVARLVMDPDRWHLDDRGEVGEAGERASE